MLFIILPRGVLVFIRCKEEGLVDLSDGMCYYITYSGRVYSVLYGM